MTDMDNIYDCVKSILEHDDKARGDDAVLYVKMCKLKNPDVLSMPFYVVMQRSRELGLPAFESVSRARRKVQSDFEYLKPSERICEARSEQEQMMFEWAQNR